jgi:cytochrome c nitrite reductase small subunit
MEIPRTVSERASRIGVVTLLIALFAGAAGGIGFFTLGYADATAYLRDDPAACANCHVMQGHLDAWIKSSHGKVATCNQCHAPAGTFDKYYCKARNGFFHSLAFTTGEFPDNLRSTDYNHRVTEQACRNCHAEVSHGLRSPVARMNTTEELSCIHCHATVGHDR